MIKKLFNHYPSIRSRTIGILASVYCVVWIHSVQAQMQFAPPSFDVDGKTAAPVDFQELNATIVFDLDTKRASAEAIVTFRMGRENAMPVFDLRQDVNEIELDGKPVSLEYLVSRDPPGLSSTPEVNQTVRVLQVVLDAESDHQLRLKYDVATPHSLDAKGPEWKDIGVEWGTWMSELRPGRFLEQWFPANLIYDQFLFELQLKVISQDKCPEHEVVTNGTTTKWTDGTWTIRFPNHFTAFSPMVVLVPCSKIETAISHVTLESGQVVELEMVRFTDKASGLDEAGEVETPELSEIQKVTERCLRKFSESFGPWRHGNKCTLIVHGGFEGMEYDGAFTTCASLLPEELLHSYIARGLKPAGQDDGWIDEAFTHYYLNREKIHFSDDGSSSDKETTQFFYSQYLKEAGQFPLATKNPWNRVTQPAAYRIGPLLFEQLAAIIGEPELDRLMRKLIEEHGATKPLTTAELESRLSAVAGIRRDDVQRLFSFSVFAETTGDVKQLFKDVIANNGLDD